MSLDVTTLSNTTSLGSRNATSTTGSTDEVMGKTEFLNLLVAQLKNQDPLNPDEGTEFASQLAQYSSLEQLMNLNTTAATMLQATANSDSISLLSTIGNDVLYYGNEFAYEEGPVDMGYVIGENATDVSIEIKLNGQTVRTISGEDFTPGTHTFQWDGLTDKGEPAIAGDYTIEVTANSSGTVIPSASVLKAEVTRVNLDPSGASLTTKLGDIPSYSYILGIYQRESGDSSNIGGDDTTDTDDDIEKEPFSII